MQSLSREEAVTRARLVRVHAYQVDLDLTGLGPGPGGGGTRFASTTRVTFSCAEPGASTFVEVKAVDLHEVRLNGRPLDLGPARGNPVRGNPVRGNPVRGNTVHGNRITLSGLAAENELVVRATMACSNTGEGLHRFVDPADGAVYLYLQSFLDDAQRVFACFDQPDLKAPVRLTVTAPPDWEVRANGAGRRVAPGRWEFAETAPLATYLVTLLAGPYHIRQATHDGIELGLLCRKSLAPHLDADAEEIFGITASCLDHYHRLFGVRYPFGKYDQAFVPEFNMGAMENPGLVTFRDEFVFRSAVTEAERQQRAVVIAHEMAHMWFGDLVTMRWWDDLWLNESFAEYMGQRVTAEATRFTGAWTGFAVGRKGWGYAADQRPSTHPVAPEEVADSAHALLNFDGISYAKGASVLRQLVEWVGDDAFLAGLRGYFAAHRFGNATLADLLTALSKASGRDLTGWAEVWLRRAQVNTLRPEVRLAADGSYAAVEVVQTAPPSHPTLRPHRIGIGVYDLADEGAADEGAAGDGAVGEGGPGRGPVVRVRRVEVDLDPDVDGGRTPVPALAGTRPGRLLLLNDGDLTYAKVRLTPDDLARLADVLPAMTDPLARAVTWAAAADATRDAEWPATRYLALAAAALPAETDVTVFEDTLRFASSTVVACFLPPGERAAASASLAAACRRVLAAAGPGDPRLLAAARGVVQCAGPADTGTLADWLAGRGLPDGLTMDADLRWLVLHRLVVLGAAGEEQIDAELRRDTSARAAEQAARARAAIGDAAAKERAWRMIFEDAGLSARLLAATADGFWQPEQEELTAGYVARYFAEMPRLAAVRPPQALRQLAAAAFPRYAVSAATVAAADTMLARPDLDPMLARVVTDAADDLRRALAARELAARALG